MNGEKIIIVIIAPDDNLIDKIKNTIPNKKNKYLIFLFIFLLKNIPVIIINNIIKITIILCFIL